MNDLEKIGHALRMRRHDLRLNQHAVAEIAGIDRSYISGIENGIKNPALVTFIALAQALEVEPGKLLDDALSRK